MASGSFFTPPASTLAPTKQFINPSQVVNVSSFNSVTQTNSIDWIFNHGIIAGNNTAVTASRIYTRAGFWQEKFRTVTSELWMTHLKLPDYNMNVVGVEFLLDMQRQARIEDLVIQLTLGGVLIGDNLASTVNPVQSDMYTSETTTPLNPVGDYNIYGGPSNLWGATLTSANIADPTFGVVVSFQSNIIYPHSDLAYINQVGLRITYA